MMLPSEVSDAGDEAMTGSQDWVTEPTVKPAPAFWKSTAARPAPLAKACRLGQERGAVAMAKYAQVVISFDPDHRASPGVQPESEFGTPVRSGPPKGWCSTAAPDPRSSTVSSQWPPPLGTHRRSSATTGSPLPLSPVAVQRVAPLDVSRAVTTPALRTKAVPP